jgi:hypothetical protein
MLVVHHPTCTQHAARSRREFGDWLTARFPAAERGARKFAKNAAVGIGNAPLLMHDTLNREVRLFGNSVQNFFLVGNDETDLPFQSQGRCEQDHDSIQFGLDDGVEGQACLARRF